MSELRKVDHEKRGELDPRHEHDAHKSHETPASIEHQAKAEKQREAAAEHARMQAESAEDVAELHERAEQLAISEEDYRDDQKNEEEPAKVTYLGTQTQIKNQAFKQTLQATQRKLPKTARRFSKVVHNDVVNTVSEASAKTVARPLGLLGGSMVAFFGSLIFLYYARHYGFHYNYLVLFMLFIVGFLVGAIIEGLVWVVYTRRQRHRHYQ